MLAADAAVALAAAAAAAADAVAAVAAASAAAAVQLNYSYFVSFCESSSLQIRLVKTLFCRLAHKLSMYPNYTVLI